MRSRSIALVLSAPLLLSFASCSDNDSSSSPALTLEEFQNQGNAICTQGGSDLAALFSSGKDPSTMTDAEKKTLFDQILSITRKQATDISSLNVSKDVDSKVKSLMADIGKKVDELESGGPDALFATEGDPFAEFNPRFTELGLNACANGG